MLSFLLAPKGSPKKMNTSRDRMVWQESRDKKNYHLVNWPAIKDSGGLWVLGLQAMWQSMIVKWLWKLKIMRGCGNLCLAENIWRIKPYQDWLMGLVAPIFGKTWWRLIHFCQKNAERLLENGMTTLFWEDIWVGEKSLADKFPRLYSICFTKRSYCSLCER